MDIALVMQNQSTVFLLTKITNREVFGIRCSITRNMQYGNAELKKQMVSG